MEDFSDVNNWELFSYDEEAETGDVSSFFYNDTPPGKPLSKFDRLKRWIDETDL